MKYTANIIFKRICLAGYCMYKVIARCCIKTSDYVWIEHAPLDVKVKEFKNWYKSVGDTTVSYAKRWRNFHNSCRRLRSLAVLPLRNVTWWLNFNLILNFNSWNLVVLHVFICLLYEKINGYLKTYWSSYFFDYV